VINPVIGTLCVILLLCLNYPKGVADNTHFNDYGATIMAGNLVKAITSSDIPLKKQVKGNLLNRLGIN